MDLQRFQHEIEAILKEINNDTPECIPATLCCQFLELTKKFAKDNVQNFEELSAGLEFSLRTYIPFRRKFAEIQDEADELGRLIFMQCARLVLGVEFQRLGEEDGPKVSLKRTLGEAYTQLQPFPMVGHLFLVLPWLMVNSWSHPTLVAMMGGDDIDEETAFTYLKSGEYPEIFRLRIEMLIEGGVDAFALNLCNWCAKSDTFREDLTVRKSQFRLMHRLEKRSEFLNECRHMNCCLGVKIIEDFKEDSEFQSAGLMMAQYLLIQDLTKQSKHCCTKVLMKSWLALERSEEPDDKEFLESVSKVSNFISNPDQLIAFSAVMIELFQSSYLEFCTELLLKVIKTERYKLDSARIMKNENESNEAADILGKLCYQIVCLYQEHTAMYLSSLLTTIYLDPSVEIYSRFQKIMTDQPELEECEDLEDLPSPEGLDEELYHDLFENVETLRPGAFHIREGWDELKKTIFYHMEQCGYSYNESENVFTTDSDSDAETIDYQDEQESAQENDFEDKASSDKKSCDNDSVQDQMETSQSNDIEDPGGGNKESCVLEREENENSMESTEMGSNAEQDLCKESEISEEKEDSMDVDDEESCDDIKNVSINSQATISDFQRQFMNFTQSSRFEDEMSEEEEEISQETGSTKSEKESNEEEGTKTDEKLSTADVEEKKETETSSLEIIEDKNKRNEQLKIETATDEADILRLKLDQTLSSVLEKSKAKQKNEKESTAEEKVTTDPSENLESSEDKQIVHQESDDKKESELQTDGIEKGCEGNVSVDSMAINSEENSNKAAEEKQKDTDINNENTLSQDVDENIVTTEKMKKNHEYMCNYCGKVFDGKLKRRRHQEWMCTKKDFYESKSSACEICGKNFRSGISLKRHYTQFHRVTEPVRNVFDGVKLPQGVNCNVANCEVTLSPLNTDVVAKYESQPVVPKRGRGRPRKVEIPPEPTSQKKKGHSSKSKDSSKNHKRSIRTRDSSGFYKEWSDSESNDEDASSATAEDTGDAVSSQEEDQESTHSSTYECKHCDLTFTNIEESDKHKKLCSLAVDLLGLVTCNDCGANFEGKKSLREHVIVCEKGRKKYEISQEEDSHKVKVEMNENTTASNHGGNVANDTVSISVKDEKSSTDIKFMVDYYKPAVLIEESFLMYKYTTAGRCPACAKIFETGKECKVHQNKECFPERGVKIITGYQCVVCRNNFLTPKICRAHMQKECNTKAFLAEKRKCKLCTKHFSSPQNYWAHLSQVHKSCTTPNKDFVQNSGERTTLTAGDKEVIEITQYSCSKCVLRFYEYKDISKHCETVCKGADILTVKRLECSNCSCLFEDASQLSDHLLLCQGFNKLSLDDKGDVIYSGIKYCCTICKASFLQRRYVFDHLNRKHQDIDLKDRPKHVIEVKDAAPLQELYRCNICGRNFPYSTVVLKHICSNHPDIPENERKSKVTIFKTTNANMGNNETPEMKKKKLFSYKCRLCGKVLSSKFLVKKHITRLHLELAVEDMDKSIEKVDRIEPIKHHEKPKTVVDPTKPSAPTKKVTRKLWRCKLCKKEYLEYDVLLSHLGQDHSDEEKQSYFNAMKKDGPNNAPVKKYYFRCKVCDTKLSSRGLAKEHITINHPQVNPQEMEQMILYVPPEQGTTEVKDIANQPTQTVPPTPTKNCLFHCNICRTNFTSLHWVTDHISLQHPEIPKDIINKYITGTEEHVVNYSCRLCAAVYGQRETALDHIRLAHQGILMGKPVEEFVLVCNIIDQYQCRVCGEKLKTLDAGKVHLSTQHNLIVIGVEQCRKFITPMKPPAKVEQPKVVSEKPAENMSNHIFAVEVKKALQYRVKKDPQKVPMRYTCQVCQKEFIQLYYAKLHLRVKHSDLPLENRGSYITSQPLEKIFKCTVCGQTFKDQKIAQTHLQEAHLGNDPANQRPEACIVIEYDTKKKQAKSTKTRKIYCDLCGITFDKIANAKSHFESSHQNITVTDWKPKKTVCLECKKEFDSWEDGETHIHSEHTNVQEGNVENILVYILEKEVIKKPKKVRYQCKLCRLKMTGKEEARKHFELKHKSSQVDSETQNQNNQIGSETMDQNSQIGSETMDGNVQIGNDTQDQKRQIASEPQDQNCQIGSEPKEGNMVIGEETQPSAAPDIEKVAQVEEFDFSQYFTVVQKNFSCNKCKVKGYTKAFITRHQSKKHNITSVLSSEVHICGLCYKVYTLERYWAIHMKLCHKDVDNNVLEQNKNKYHKKYTFKFNLLYKCAVCFHQFKDLDVMKYHLEVSHPDICHGLAEAERAKYIMDVNPEENRHYFKCRLCQQLSPNIQLAGQHLINYHRGQFVKEDGTFNKNLITIVDSSEIEGEHAANVKYLCKLCQRHFQDVDEAQNHIRDVHNMIHLNDAIKNNVLFIEISQEKENSDQETMEKSFCCTLCGDNFKDIQRTEKHVATCHSDVKKENTLENVMKKKAFMKLAIGFIFVCKACNYNFEGNRAQVKTHIAEVHPEIKEESVMGKIKKISLLKKIPKRFKVGKEIKKKVCRVKLTKVFECNLCQYKAGTKYTLRKHVKVKHTHVSYDDINEHIKRYVVRNTESIDQKEIKKSVVRNTKSIKPKEIKTICNQIYKCKICGLKKFIFKQSARSHIKKHHPDIPYEEINKNISTEEGRLEKSKKVKLVKSKLPDSSIKSISTEGHTAEEVNKNISIESSSPKRPPSRKIQLIRICKICDWKTTEKRRAQTHVKTTHPEYPEENMEQCFRKIHKKLAYKCKQCTFVHQTEREIFVHIAENHGIQDGNQMLQMIEQLSVSVSVSETNEQNKKISTISDKDMDQDINIPKQIDTNTPVQSSDGVIKMSPFDLQIDSVRRKEELGKAIVVGKVLDSELSHLKSMAATPSTATYQQYCSNTQHPSTTTSYELALPTPGLLADVTSRISCYTINSDQYVNPNPAEKTVSEAQMVQATAKPCSSTLQNSQAGSLERTVPSKTAMAGKTMEAMTPNQPHKTVDTLRQSIVQNEKKSNSMNAENVLISQSSSNVMHGSIISTSVAPTKPASTDRKRDAFESKIGDLLEYYTRVNKSQRESLSEMKGGIGKRGGGAKSKQKDKTTVTQASSQSQQLVYPTNSVPGKQVVTSSSVVNQSASQQFVPQSTIVTHDVQASQMSGYTVPSYIEMAAPPNVTLLPNSQTVLGQSQEVLNICGTQNIYVQNQQEMDLGQGNMLVAPSIVLQQPTQQASPLQIQQNAAGALELVVPAQQQSPFQLHQDAAGNLGVMIPAQQTPVQCYQDSEGNFVMQENTAVQLQQTSDGNMMYSASQPQVLSYSLSPQMQGGGILLAQQNISSTNLPQNVMSQPNITSNNLPQNVMSQQNVTSNSLPQSVMSQQNISSSSLLQNVMSQQNITSHNLPQNVMASRVRQPQCMSIPKPVTTPIQSNLNLPNTKKPAIIRSDQGKRSLPSGHVNTSLNNTLQPTGAILGVNRVASNNLTSMPLSASRTVRSHQQIRPKAPLSVPQPQVIMSSGQLLQNKPIAQQQRLPASLLENKKSPVVVPAKKVVTLSPTQIITAKKGEITSNGQMIATDKGLSNKPVTGSTQLRLAEVVSKRFLSGPTMFDCTSCGEIFLDEKSLESHKSSKCTVCKPCNISFANRILMDEHLQVVHAQGTKQKHTNVINIAPVTKTFKSKTTKEARIIPKKESLFKQRNVPVPQKEAANVPMKSLLSPPTVRLSNVLDADHNSQEIPVSQLTGVVKNATVPNVVMGNKKGTECNVSVSQDERKDQEIKELSPACPVHTDVPVNQDENKSQEITEVSSTCPVHKDEKKSVVPENQEEKPQTELNLIGKMISPEVIDVEKSETLKEIEGSVISVKVPPIEELVNLTYQVESNTLSVSRTETETESVNTLAQNECNSLLGEVKENEIEMVSNETDDEAEKQKIQSEGIEKKCEDNDQELCNETMKEEEGSGNEKWIDIGKLTPDEIIDVDSVSNTVVLDVTNVSQVNLIEGEMKEEGGSGQENESKVDIEICESSKVEGKESKPAVCQTCEETNASTSEVKTECEKCTSKEKDSEQNHSSVVGESDSNQDEIKDEFLKCQHCAVNICFKNGEDLKQHMKLVHGDPNIDESNFSMVCAICRDQAIYVTEFDFKCHMKWMHHVNWVKPKQLGRTGSTESESSSNESQTEVKPENVPAKRGRPRKQANTSNTSKVTPKTLAKKQEILRATPERLSNRAIEKIAQKEEAKEKSETEPKKHSGNKTISPRKIIEVGSGKKWGMRNLAARRAGRAAANLLQKSKTSARIKARGNAGFQRSEMYTQRQLACLRNQTTTDTYNQVGAVTTKTETENKGNTKKENTDQTKGHDVNDQETVRKTRRTSCSTQEDGSTRRSTRLSTSPNKEVVRNNLKRQTRQSSPNKEKAKDVKKKASVPKVSVQCPWNLNERISKAEANKRGVTKPTNISVIKTGQKKYRKVGRPSRSPSKEVKSGSKETKFVHVSKTTNKGTLIKRRSTSPNKSIKNSEGKQQNLQKRERSNSSSPTRKKQMDKVDEKNKSVVSKNNSAPGTPILGDGGDKFTKRVTPSGPRDIAARLKSMKQRKRSIKAERKETQEKADVANAGDKDSKDGISNNGEKLSPELNCTKENTARKEHTASNPSIQYDWRCAVCSESFEYHHLWEKHCKTHSESEIKIHDIQTKECGHSKRQLCHCFKQDDSAAHKEIFDKMVKRKYEENLANTSSPSKEITPEKVAVSKTSPSKENTTLEDSSSKEKTASLTGSPSKEKTTLPKGSPSKGRTSPPKGSPSKGKTNLSEGSPSKGKIAQQQSKTNKGKNTNTGRETSEKMEKDQRQESRPKKDPILSGSPSKKNTSSQKLLSNTPTSRGHASKTALSVNKNKNQSSGDLAKGTLDVSKPTKTRGRPPSVSKQNKVATNRPLQPKTTEVKKSETKKKLSVKVPSKEEGVDKSGHLKKDEEQNLKDKTPQESEKQETAYESSDEEVSFSPNPSWKKANSSFEDTWTNRSDKLIPPIKTYQRQKVKRRSSVDSNSSDESKKKEKKTEPAQKEEKSPTSMYDGIKNRKRARSNSTDSNVSVQSHKTDTPGKTPARNDNKNTKKLNVGEEQRNDTQSKEKAKKARSCSPDTKSPQMSKETDKNSALKQNGSPEITTKDSSNKSNVDNSENRRFSRSRTLSSSSNVSDVSASSSRSRTSSKTSERNLLSTLSEGREKEQGVKDKPKTRHQMAEEAKNNNLVLRNARQVSKRNAGGRWIQAPAGVIKTPISPKTQMIRKQSVKISNKRKANTTPQTPPHSAKRKK